MESFGESDEVHNIVKLVKQLIKEDAYDGVYMLFKSSKEASKNIKHIPAIAIELYNVCLEHLTAENNSNKPELYGCVEELLKIVAEHAPIEELLIELMEEIEECNSECVFTSLLKALQVVLLRQGAAKPRAIEWSLHSIKSRLESLPLPQYLTEGYDSTQARLLEQDVQVQSVLTHYIMVSYFYEPLLHDILVKDLRKPSEIFRNCDVNRRNVFCCFFVHLLGKPLALLDLSRNKNVLSNCYAQQRIQNLTYAITKCIVDPYYFLGFVEQRKRWHRRLDYKKGVYEMSSHNMFLIEDKLPLYAVGIYYHALFVDELFPSNAPKVYSPYFLFESGLYLALELFEQRTPPLQLCGVRLIDKLLNIFKLEIPSISLELEVHKKFCLELCDLIGFSPQNNIRRLSLSLLKTYILSFDDESKYLILNNLLGKITHSSLKGYLCSIYKDLVALHLCSNKPMPDIYTSTKFRDMMKISVNTLPEGVETDLVENSDQIINALNIVRFFIIADKKNLTGFWDLINEIESQFLKPLRTALDMSLSHFKASYELAESGQDDEHENEMMKKLDISFMNSGDSAEPINFEINRNKKLEVLSFSITTLEMIMALLGRTHECLALYSKQLMPQQSYTVNN